MLLNLLRIFFQFHRNSFTFVHQRVRFPLNFRGIDFPGRRRFWKDSVDSQKSEAGLLSSLVRVCTYNIHEHVSIENQREISNDRAGWLASTKGCHAEATFGLNVLSVCFRVSKLSGTPCTQRGVAVLRARL